MAEKDTTARLRRAVMENNLFLVKRLIQRTDMRNPDPSHRRYTSLAWAASLGNEETFEFLLSRGHDDYELSKDSDNNTILMILADQRAAVSSPYANTQNGNTDNMRATMRMARLYYDRYPKILDWPNVYGRTALHFAAQKGNEELVRMFCDLGADFNLADNKGNTPLHFASTWGHIAVVQLLIERGCHYLARNDEGFTADDYAYSFNTRDTLQDTARLQVENNKKSRRAIYQQSAARGSEFMPVPPALSPTPSKARDMYALNGSRMRSGSGTSRTTNTSDSGEQEVNGLSPGHPSNSISSSPSQPSGAMSQHSQSPSVSSSMALSNPASVLSSFASRVLERDASAMEKYMQRNRSESQGTASTTDSKSANGSLSTGPSVNGNNARAIPSSGATTPKRLRPSISAQQLRSGEPLLPVSSPLHSENRNRSGTSPAAVRPPVTLLTRSSSITNGSRTLTRTDESVIEDPENFTGPPSQYAQFPEPPAKSEEDTIPVATKRKAFYATKSKDSLDASVNHRRGTSATSLRGT